MKAPLPPQEQERLQALERCQLLDTPPEEAYDRLTRIAAQVFSTPIAAVSLVAEDRQFYKSILGLETGGTSREVSFCAHTILGNEPLVVLDARKDPRFHDNPFVTGAPDIRFYCGVPVRSPDGYSIGALCVVDTKPRTEVPRHLLCVLQELAAQVSGEIVHREKHFRLASTSTALRERERELAYEKQLRYNSEIRAELALEAGNMGSWEWDAASRQAVFSPVMQRLFGYASYEARPFHWLEPILPEDRKMIGQRMRTAQARGGVFDVEFRIHCADKGVRWLALKGCYRRNGDGKLVGANGVSWDITDRKRAEEDLRLREELFRGISASSPVGIFQADLNGNVYYANPRSCEIWAMSAEEMKGSGWVARLHPEDASSLVDGWVRANVQGQPYEHEYRLLLPDGTVRWVHGRSSILRDRNGGLIGTVGTVDDISELRRASLEQGRAREMAEEANRAKSFFLANVSHELRTPLNGVLGMTDLLLGGPLDSEQRELAETVKQSGLALLALVNDLLDLSRVEAGKLAYQQAAFDLQATIQQAVALVTPTAQKKGLQLMVDYPVIYPRLLIGDENRIRQIVLNYLNNALKFTNQGYISVHVCTESWKGKAAQMMIAVRDTGPGVPPALQSDLFTPFRQADASSTRQHGGLGLGLALSKQIAEAMGGSVGLSSTPPYGSTFWVRLPLALAEEPTLKGE